MESGEIIVTRHIPVPKFNLNKDVTPSQLDESQQANLETMQRILEEGYSKLKIVLILPLILSNPETFNRFVGSKNFEAVKAVRKFLNFHKKKLKEERDRQAQREADIRAGKWRPSMEDSDSFESFEQFDKDTKYLANLDQEIVEFVDFFSKNLKVLKHLTKFVAKLSEKDCLLLDLFKYAKDLALGHLARTGKFSLELEMLVQKMYNYNNRVRANIIPLKRGLRKTLLIQTVELATTRDYMKKVAEKVRIKEIATSDYLHYNRTVAKKEMENEKAEMKRTVARLQEELETMRVNVNKRKFNNEVEILELRRELSKAIASYENLVIKHDKTMIEKYKEIERTKIILAVEDEITKELDKRFQALKQRHFAIVEMYYIKKLRLFWQKLMVRKIENWICAVWKRIEEKKRAEEEGEEIEDDNPEGEDA